MTWQPISTLPAGSQIVMAWCPPCRDFPEGRMMPWRSDLLRGNFGGQTPAHLAFPATLWQPMPEAPKEEPAPPAEIPVDPVFPHGLTDWHRTSTFEDLDFAEASFPATGTNAVKQRHRNAVVDLVLRAVLDGSSAAAAGGYVVECFIKPRDGDPDPLFTIVGEGTAHRRWVPRLRAYSIVPSEDYDLLLAAAGSNVVVLPTETIDILDRIAAHFEFDDRDTLVEVIVDNLDTGENWEDWVDCDPERRRRRT